MARQAKIRWDKTGKRWYVYFNGRKKPPNLYGRFYVRTSLVDFKAFVKWLDQEEIIERLPRNFARLKIEAQVLEPPTIPTAEVRAILKKAVGKTAIAASYPYLAAVSPLG